MGEKHKYSELRDKILKGMKTAIELLIADAKIKDEELVFSDSKGNPVRVKARSLK